MYFFKITENDRGDLQIFITTDGLLMRKSVLLCNMRNFNEKKVMLSSPVYPHRWF